MKIKCFSCNKEFETELDFYPHLLSGTELHDSECMAHYTNLLFKIHEKITELEPLQPNENYQNSWDAEQWSFYDRMQVLKSLLEDKK